MNLGFFGGPALHREVSSSLATDSTEAWRLDFLDDSESRFEDFEVPRMIEEDDFNASSLRRLIASAEILSSSRSFGFVVRFRFGGSSIFMSTDLVAMRRWTSTLFRFFFPLLRNFKTI